MKIVYAIARYLLGAAFLFFGSNLFLNFMKGKLPDGPAATFVGLLVSAHYTYVIGALMVVSGILFLVNRFVALGLVLLGPVLVNILMFHILILSDGFQAGVVLTLLWFLVFWQHRSAFAGIFSAKLKQQV
jgi:putative oxidoreductase